jgi:hypothetical protein
MEERNLDDIYVFYIDSGYVNARATQEYTLAEITGCETEEELNDLNDYEIDQMLDDCYDNFIAELDSGFYKK